MKEDSCEECLFFVRHSDKAGFGVCKRFPPTIIVEENIAITRSPVLHLEDWCGEFKQKEIKLTE